MRGLTLEAAARACGGRYIGSDKLLNREIEFITTDSRKASDGCLFAAIPGERVDGHSFISGAFRAGALCAICERVPENVEGACIVVPSTQDALGAIAAYYRTQFDIPFVGITGSVGKTTAKELIAAVLSRRFNVLKTEGNFNNELGVPLTLFRLRDEHEAAVVEMGISHFGEMRRLSNMVKPDMAVFTVIGYSHLEFLKNREGVLRAKSEITEHMQGQGTVFVNGDDDLLRSMSCAQNKVTFGLSNECGIRAENVEYSGLDGMTFDIVCPPRRIHAHINAFGVHVVTAALAAAAVGIHLGLTDDEIRLGIDDYRTISGRALAENTGFCTVIDDAYNSNPTSASAAIASLAALGGRRVCILGDMRELGEASESLHAEVGRLAAESGIDLIICCGEQAAAIRSGANEVGPGSAVMYYPEMGMLIKDIQKLIRRGDSVLVKASHSMRFEEIVKALKALK